MEIATEAPVVFGQTYNGLDIRDGMVRIDLQGETTRLNQDNS
jgi:hypothetical protein